MKKQVLVFAVVALAVAFMFGCAPKPPVMQDGKQVGIFVLVDRGTTAGTKEDERNDRNEMGQHMEDDIVDRLRDDGYNATLIQSQGQYIQGPANYLVAVKMVDLRLVGRAQRQWGAGVFAGPSILKTSYEVSGTSGRLSLSYRDEESTLRDWTECPEQLNRRLVGKINDRLIGKK